jgi:dUTP pyrophosphatase
MRINKPIDFRFANKSTNPNPEFATVGSSGFDLRASLESDLPLLPASRHVIPTGLYFELPEDFEIQIRPRSGLAAKNGLTVLNAVGTVDADYRGEIKVILINHSDTTFVVKHGDRIAQAVIAEVVSKTVINLMQVDEISTDTVRSSGGFGSTGIN